MTAPSPRPTAPDTTGGELRSVRSVTREHAVDPRLSDGSPAFTMGSWTCSCGAGGANGSRGHADHVGERVDAALPALRDLLAERDALRAAVDKTLIDANALVAEVRAEATAALAERDTLAAKVRAVRELADTSDRMPDGFGGLIASHLIRRALDGAA